MKDFSDLNVNLAWFVMGKVNRPEYVKSACEASLRRLKTDYIDILYAHRINPTQSVEEMVYTMAELVREGKVGAIGISEAAPETIRRAHAVYPLAAVETEYSLFSCEPELAIIPTCRELGIGFVPYAPLSRGLLAGNAPSASQLNDDDFRKQLPRFQSGNFETNQSIVNQLRPIAERKNCTLAQLSLAWLLVKGADIIPIPGTRQVEHLDENLQARFIELSAVDLQEIEQIFPLGKAAGERYSDEELLTVNL